jgi:hypothetical protein
VPVDPPRPVDVVPAFAGRATARVSGAVRTSLSFPLSLHDRLALAVGEYRWNLPDLLRRGLASPPSIKVAEVCWRVQRGERCAPRGMQMDAGIAQGLDRLAGEWRMNRSQVARVLLTLVLDDLGVVLTK